jgi:hypothetical protein
MARGRALVEKQNIGGDASWSKIRLQPASRMIGRIMAPSAQMMLLASAPIQKTKFSDDRRHRYGQHPS